MIDFNSLTVPELRVIAFEKLTDLTRTAVRAMRKGELVTLLVAHRNAEIAKYALASKPNKTTRPYLRSQRHPLGERYALRDEYAGRDVIFRVGKRLLLGKVISMVPRLEDANARWLLVVLHPNGFTRSLHAPRDVAV